MPCTRQCQPVGGCRYASGSCESATGASRRAATLRELRDDLKLLYNRVNICIDQHINAGVREYRTADYIELLVIDESERLTAIEHLRDQYDRGDPSCNDCSPKSTAS